MVDSIVCWDIRRAERQSGLAPKKKSLQHIETGVDYILCQCKNGLIPMDHITLHTSHV